MGVEGEDAVGRVRICGGGEGPGPGEQHAGSGGVQGSLAEEECPVGPAGGTWEGLGRREEGTSPGVLLLGLFKGGTAELNLTPRGWKPLGVSRKGNHGCDLPWSKVPGARGCGWLARLWGQGSLVRNLFP